ncbi:unnamed protein product [Phaeothamnion confervicola]
MPPVRKVVCLLVLGGASGFSPSVTLPAVKARGKELVAVGSNSGGGGGGDGGCRVEAASAMQRRRRPRQPRLLCRMATVEADSATAAAEERQPLGRQLDAANAITPTTGGTLSTASSFERVLDGLGDSDKYNAVLQVGLSLFCLQKKKTRKSRCIEHRVSYPRRSHAPVLSLQACTFRPGSIYTRLLPQGLAGMALGKERGGAKGGRGAPLEDILQLLAEMREGGVRCSPRSAGAVLDAAAATADVAAVAAALAATRAAGAGQKYGRDLTRLAPLPSDERRRQRAMAGLPTVPLDERGVEVGYAGAFLGVVGLDLGAGGLESVLHYDATVPTLMAAATAAAVALDVFQRSGEISKQVLRGVNRLFTRDVERESRCEAAAFLGGYLTGLPCFAFEPNVFEAVRMLQRPELRGGMGAGTGTSLDSPAGAHRVLVWLLAPVAAEAAVHRQLICSDARQAAAFLDMCRKQGLGGGADALDPADDAARLDWAYNEARVLLRDNAAAFDALRQRLETGGSTVGECATLIERQRS